MSYFELRFRYSRHIEICAACDMKLFVSKRDGHSFWTVNPCAVAQAFLDQIAP